MSITKIQTVTGNNGAAAGTSVAATLAPTLQGTLLIVAICCAVAGAAITPPAGFSQVGSIMPTNPAGGSVGLFKQENNPGAITTVTFTITSSLASIVISEYPSLPTNAPAQDIVSIFSNNNGTNVTLGGSTPFAEMGELILVAVGYVNNTLLTLTPQNGFTQDGATIGTAAAGNGGIHLLSNVFTSNISMNNVLIGTLSLAPTDGPTIVAASFKEFQLQQNNGGVGPAGMVG